MRYLVAVLIVGCFVGEAAASIVVVRSDRMVHASVNLINSSVTDDPQSLALDPVDWLDLSALAVVADDDSSGAAASFLQSSFAGSTFSFNGDVAFDVSGPTAAGGAAFAQAQFLFVVTSPVTFSANLLNMGSNGVLRLGYENGAQLMEVFTGYNDSITLNNGFFYIQTVARAFDGESHDFDYSFGFDSDVSFNPNWGDVPELSTLATWSVLSVAGLAIACRKHLTAKSPR